MIQSVASGTPLELAARRRRGIVFASPGAAFTPLSLSPNLWVKADAAGTTVDGTAIASWPDQSGAGNNPAQATGSAQPLYKVGIQNGLPGVLFDGVSKQMPVTLAAVSARTMFVVMKATADTASANLLGFGSTSRARIVVGSGFSWVNDQAAAVQALGGAVSTTAQVLTIKAVSASSAVFYFRGVQTAAFDPNDQLTTGTVLDLGVDATAGTAFWPGYIFEVLHYPIALADSDRANVENYLIGRWAL